MTFDYEAYRAEQERKAEARREAWRQVQAEILVCPLRSPAIRGVTQKECTARRVCFLCGEPLGKYRRRWCSDACAWTYARNHKWGSASDFARERSQVPVVSAIATFDLLPIRASYLVSEAPGVVLLRHLRPQCERCGKRTHAIEINHVVPRNGGGYDEGCHHHQTNLEPLCHPCHVAETTAQIRERRGIPPEGRPKSAPRPSREAAPEPLWAVA